MSRQLLLDISTTQHYLLGPDDIGFGFNVKLYFADVHYMLMFIDISEKMQTSPILAAIRHTVLLHHSTEEECLLILSKICVVCRMSDSVFSATQCTYVR